MTELDKCFCGDFDVEQLENESTDRSGVMVGRDHTEGSMEEGDRGKVSRVTISNPIIISDCHSAWI